MNEVGLQRIDEPEATMNDQETLVRWWVDLNRWIWPDDLPGKPDPRFTDERDAIRGAHAVVDALVKDDAKAQKAIDKAWRKACDVVGV